MRFAAIAAALASATFVAAQQTITVLVGANATQTYQPSSVNANVGDTIVFQFQGGNHTVTQSTFASPCTMKANGVSSGYGFTPAGTTNLPEWSFTVQNASAPLWFYCQQGRHCENGMVFALNPTADKTLDAFKAAAMAANSSSTASAASSSTTTANSAISAVSGYKAALLAAVGLGAGLLL